LATVHGDSLRKRFDLVVNKFFIFGLLKKKITLFGEKNWRPLVSVDDVVKSIIIILNSPKTKISRQILNVGFSQENFTIGDIAKKIKKIINFDFKIVPQLEDTRSYKVSFKKIEKNFKFKPTLTLNQSLKKMKDVYYNKKINLNNINFYNEKKIKFLLNKKN
jgi:nucleoside-diphosphate-sugar epimerase